jgi:hypothetical protein
VREWNPDGADGAEANKDCVRIEIGSLLVNPFLPFSKSARPVSLRLGETGRRFSFLIRQFGCCLEPESRTKRYLQVIVTPVQELDLIADFQTESDRSTERFNSDARIQRKSGIPGRDRAYLIGKGSAGH